MVTIVDYGMGNLYSIQNMLKKIGVDSLITSDAEVIDKADKLILPGVGAFDRAMKSLHSLNLVEVLNKKALKEKVPILGVCLGLQLMTKSSEEGLEKGLSWFDAKALKFDFPDRDFKIPHIGWNVVIPKNNNVLFNTLPEEQRFYFVHAYYIQSNNPSEVAATAFYGQEFTCALSNENIFGVQFHPEKSHRYGMALLTKFSSI